MLMKCIAALYGFTYVRVYVRIYVCVCVCVLILLNLIPFVLCQLLQTYFGTL